MYLLNYCILVSTHGTRKCIYNAFCWINPCSFHINIIWFFKQEEGSKNGEANAQMFIFGWWEREFSTFYRPYNKDKPWILKEKLPW